MRRFYVLSAAATLSVATFAFLSSAYADDQAKQDQTAGQSAAQQTERAAERAVDRPGDTARQGFEGTAAAPDAEGIRDVLAQVAEASLTKGGLDDIVERFVDADRNRLGAGETLNQEHPTLDGRIAQFQKDWQAKYGKEFDIGDETAVYNQTFAMIRQGEIGEGARLAGERQPGAAPAPAPGPESDKVAGGDTNREPGRNIATVTIQASHGLPALNVPMIHEFPDSWRIDVPDDLTAEQLRENLLKHLTMVNEQKDQWPADENEAYRVVTHHVLMAVMNADKEGGVTGPGAGMRDNMQPRTTDQPAPAPR